MGSACSGRKAKSPEELIQSWKDDGFTIKFARISANRFELRMYYDGRQPTYTKKEYKSLQIHISEAVSGINRLRHYRKLRRQWSTDLYKASQKEYNELFGK